MSYRYYLDNNQFVAMNQLQEFELVYQDLAAEVIQKMGEDVANYLFKMEGNRLYVVQPENQIPVPTIPIGLDELASIAKDLGITFSNFENKEYEFHLVDYNQVVHGFDLHDFESRSQTMLNSFAKIIDMHFNFDQAVIPIKLPTCMSSPLCDAFILVFLHEYKEAIGELIDFTHPDYIRVNQQTTWLTKLP